jgi:hypothetical protein
LRTAFLTAFFLATFFTAGFFTGADEDFFGIGRLPCGYDNAARKARQSNSQECYGKWRRSA